MLHVPMAVAFEEQSNPSRSNGSHHGQSASWLMSGLLCQNLSTGSPGKVRSEGQWKVEQLTEQGEADNNGYIYPLNHIASHFPFRSGGSTAGALWPCG